MDLNFSCAIKVKVPSKNVSTLRPLLRALLGLPVPAHYSPRVRTCSMHVQRTMPMRRWILSSSFPPLSLSLSLSLSLLFLSSPWFAERID